MTPWENKELNASLTLKFSRRWGFNAQYLFIPHYSFNSRGTKTEEKLKEGQSKEKKISFKI